MKTNLNLRKEIEGKFQLNEIQKQSAKKVGKNLIIDAPTASGKTEAILLSIPEGSKVTWMLPTITSCTFMYRRLCSDFNNLNVSVNTSTLTEERILSDKFTTINIITCDPLMISYMRSYVEEGLYKQTTDSVLVLDEIDNYPVKVRTALKSYISNINLDQIILASATLDEELKTIKKDFSTIKFSHISNKIRYKSFSIDGYNKVDKIIKENYKKKKIGIICNCITYMEHIASRLQEKLGLNCEEDMNIIYHHSGLPNEIKLENEKRLFEKDYDLLISNDLISMSVDVDLDILIMDWSDKLNVNIQRMGRLNRRGKKANFTNLYIVADGIYPPFIDGYDADELFYNLGFGVDESKLITSDMISEWSNQIVLDEYSFNDLVNDVKSAIENNEEILLRDVPLTFRYQEVQVIQKRKKKQKISAQMKVVTIDKKMNYIPYLNTNPCSIEGGEKDLLYMYWMRDVEHPSGLRNSIWKIESYDSTSGIRNIVPFVGESFPYYGDYIEDEAEEDTDDDFSEYTHDEDGAFTAKGGWYSPSVIFNEKNEKYMKYPEALYSYEIYKRKTIFEKDYNKEEKSTLLGIIRDYYNKLLHFSKGFNFKDCDRNSMNENGVKILNYFAKEHKMNPVTLLKETCYAVREYGLDSLKSQKAALWLRIDGPEDAYLGYNRFWLALHPELKKLFIKEFEPKIRKEFDDLDYGKIKLQYEEDESIGDIPIRFTYENLSYEIPKLFIQDIWIGADE